ncbi:unnamed protein product [marine sediment metagenome]|uniref:Uncharacterized protein n=1 Tax=marine sediment metagenome TaxID=412755 RepID=X1BBA1_9ZZZZ
MGFFGVVGDLIGFAVDVVSAVVGLGISWVYAGLAWALDIVLPRDVAAGIARWVTIAGATFLAWKFYFGLANLIGRGAVRAALTVYQIYGAYTGRIAGLLPAIVIGGRWFRRLLNIWAVYGVYDVGRLAWHETD